jgi:hypothetical protein
MRAAHVVSAAGFAVAALPRLRARWKGSFGAAVGACVALALVLRAPFLGTPLGIDEGGLAYVAEHWRAHGTSLYGDLWLDRPPLLLLAIRLAVTTGGMIGVRLLGAVAAGALVVVAALVARELGGVRAGRAAAVATAVLASSRALDSVYTPAELLGAVPSTTSVLCLLVALRTGRARYLLAAGALATSAALVKQSFLDAALAGVVFLVAGARHGPPAGRFRAPACWLAGALVPLLAVAAASRAGDLRGGELPYALLGFRLDALRALGGRPATFGLHFLGLVASATASGLAFAACLAAFRARRLRFEPRIAWTLAAWLVGGLAGVLAGGSYWSHYLIEVVPVTAVAFGVAIAEMTPAMRRAVLGGGVALALAGAGGTGAYVAWRPPYDAEQDVGTYIRAHARPGDTQYVMYARADVLYYAGLRTPYPYDWSLMVRAHPGARRALYGLLASPRRPTWLVAWQDDDRWRLDRGDLVDVLLRRYYRPVAVVAGHRILREV